MPARAQQQWRGARQRAARRRQPPAALVRQVGGRRAGVHAQARHLSHICAAPPPPGIFSLSPLSFTCGPRATTPRRHDVCRNTCPHPKRASRQPRTGSPRRSSSHRVYINDWDAFFHESEKLYLEHPAHVSCKHLRSAANKHMSAKLPEHAMDCEVSGIIAGQWQPSTRAIHRICQGPTRSATSKDVQSIASPKPTLH